VPRWVNEEGTSTQPMISHIVEELHQAVQDLSSVFGDNLKLMADDYQWDEIKVVI
jgi:hypothetical protein